MNPKSLTYAVVYQLDDLIDRTIGHSHSLKIQWISEHSRITGNMEADKLTTSVKKTQKISLTKTDIKS